MSAMDIGQIPLFAMLRSRMGYLSQREQVIAQNVANADTPGYAPRDLQVFRFDATSQARQASASGMQAVTQPGHMSAPDKGGRGAGVRSIKTKSSETTLNGNGVTLEEEMIKMTDARMSYEAAVGFYEKSINMLRMATRRPGSGA